MTDGFDQRIEAVFPLGQNEFSDSHAFEDGNKRQAAMAMLVFLDANGTNQLPKAADLEAKTMAVARSEMSKTEASDWLRQQISS